MYAANGTLGGSALASWTPFWGLVLGFLAICAGLFAYGRPAERRWPLLQPLSRIPDGLERLTGIPGWAGVAIGTALYGLLVAGQGFYSDVAWHIALGRDTSLFTAPHSGILLGLVMILGGAVVGTLVATFEGIDGRRLGGLRIPTSLLPLWALGVGAVIGFPLDDVWHAEYGVDVTMWSPTHMLMILGATFTGLAAWLILAESGVHPTDGAWARGAHLLCAWLTLQGLLAPLGEFTFGVPQFRLVFSPILVCLASGLGLVVIRLVHGRWWTLGLVAVNFVLQLGGFTGGDSPVTTRFGATFLASAVVVEAAAGLLGTERRTRFALASGVGVGTLGLAGEWIWNAHAKQPWTGDLFPEALVYGLIAAVGAAVLGATVARAFERGRPEARPSALPRVLVGLAALACVAVVVIPLRRPTGDVTASIHLEPGREAGTVVVTAQLTPADAADHAEWFQASAWQGGGLELADMRSTGTPGAYRSDGAVPVTGHWKTLLRLHRGAEMMAVPVFLPADTAIKAAEIPARDRTVPFASEKRYLLRETHGGSAWLSPAVHGTLALVCLVWALAFATAVRDLSPGGGDDGVSRRRPAGRRSAAAAAA
jgi:hypothetical protein